MSKNFLVFLGIGLAVVGVVVALTLFGTRGAHLSLAGSVLKVRTMPTDENNSLVVVDFRVHNTADATPFVINPGTLCKGIHVNQL